MRDFLNDLNVKQREAVTAPLGPVLVLAGAGSGKTRVLTFRIAYLIKEKIFKPENLLALTFTNKAAGEMMQRVNALTSVHPSITMGTFHSVLARILRREISKLELGYDRNYVIFDTDDSERLLKQILMEKHLTEKFRPAVFAYYIGQAKNRLVTPAGLELENSFFQDTLEEVYEEYQARLMASNAVDFDDLLRLPCDLFQKRPGILEKYQRRFQYVLVDEYQDTNHAQYMLLRMLVAKRQNLFVVGDDAQSIYGFRGANMQNILNFEKDYPQATVIYLEQNYRSSQKILDVAHRVINLNPFQYEKKLWTENKEGEKVILYEAQDEMDEAQSVIDRITNQESSITENEDPIYISSEETPILDRFLAHGNIRSMRPVTRNTRYVIPDDLNQSVILYRTHAQSRPFEEALLAYGVPYQIVGGIKFYERREIKDMLAYLRLVKNSRDLVSLSRVINIPARGIGPAALRDVVKGVEKYDSNFDRIGRNADKLGLNAKAAEGVREFFTFLGKARNFPKEKSLPVLMKLLVERSGYKDMLLDGSPEGETRWENIEQLFNVAARYRSLPWAEGLENFLEEAALMTDLDSMDESGEKLTLMTLHSAKGLEFEKVFLVGLEEGLLPHSRSLLSPGETAEEIRLAYVGMTRAKKQLNLSYARQRQSYGEIKRSVPSRILKAIPKSLINKLNRQ